MEYLGSSVLFIFFIHLLRDNICTCAPLQQRSLTEVEETIAKQIIDRTSIPTKRSKFSEKHCSVSTSTAISDASSCPWYYEKQNIPTLYYPSQISKAVLKCKNDSNQPQPCVSFENGSDRIVFNMNGVCKEITEVFPVIKNGTVGKILEMETIVTGFVCERQSVATPDAASVSKFNGR